MTNNVENLIENDEVATSIQNAYNASSIQSLKGLEPVFFRPGMYIGSTDAKGVQHALTEIIDNSVDEHNGGFCNKIIVELYEDNSVSVTDNGRGIPTDIHEEEGISAATLVVTSLHAGGKFGGEGSSYHRTGGLHGVGASVVNALSDWFEMTIWRDGLVHFQRFSLVNDENGIIPGNPEDILKVIGSCDKDKTGTKIKFKLNAEKFSSQFYDEDSGKSEIIFYEFDKDMIAAKLQSLSFLNDGLELVFINHRDKENATNFVPEKNDYLETSIEEDGTVTKKWLSHSISNFLNIMTTTALDNEVVEEDDNDLMNKPVSDAIIFEKEVDEKINATGDVVNKSVFVKVALQWFHASKGEINGFTNNIHTPLGGSHITGFKRALTKSVSRYLNENGTDKEKKDLKKIDSGDILEGLFAVVSIKIDEPQFEGQTKEKLATRDAESAVYNTTLSVLNKMFDENPSIARSLLQKISSSKNAREAADRARKNAYKEKSNNSVFSKSPKLADCQSRNPEECEIFLVEGDSAGGSAKMARDKKTQAILPLKGKILNVYNDTNNRVFKNEEIASLIATLGCGVETYFDIEKLKYHKIICMTDADVDGSHIRALLITFFYQFLPELVKQDKIYIAIPPLYRASKKKGNEKAIYIRNDKELDKFKLKNKDDLHLYEFNRFKGLGEMNPDQLQETTMDKENRTLGLIKYDPLLKEHINEVFDILMGSSSDKRKEFINTYQFNDLLYQVDEKVDFEDS